MKNFFAILAMTAFSAAALAQKTVNDPNAEKRNVSGYHSIQVSGGIDLYLSEGAEAVAVSASESRFRDNIKTEVKNGVLKIWYDHKSNVNLDWSNRKMKAYVSYKSLDMLGGSGGSDINVDGVIKAGNFVLDLSGGSDFEGKVEVNDLKVNASGGSDINISGSAKKLDIDASGGSDFDGFGLAADVCNLEASGGSDINITVNKELNANASGSSDVSYKGNGVVREMKSSGSSSIKKQEAEIIKLKYMKKTVVIFLGLIASLAICAQQVNDPNAEIRQAKDYHGISISNAFDVFLTQSNEEAVAVSASETKFRDRIKVEVKDGILHISYNSEGKWGQGNKKLKAYISFRQIDRLNISGASDVYISGTIKGEDLDVHLSGASDLKGKMDIKKLSVDLSGASDMNITGAATQLTIEASGASAFRGFEMITDHCSARASGASDIKITVNKELSAQASGASDVKYKGTGVIRDLKTSGASSVSRSGS